MSNESGLPSPFEFAVAYRPSGNLPLSNEEAIATGFVESAVNQIVSKRFVKKQQMQWTKEGAHLLLQVRTQVLDERLEATFRTWYPDFRPAENRAQKAA
jgi:hypothetical protein